MPVGRRRRAFCLVLSFVPGLLAGGLVLLGGPGVVWPGPFCLVLSILGRFLAGGLLRAGGRPARALLLPLVSLALSLVRLVARRRLARGFTLGPGLSSVYNACIDPLIGFFALLEAFLGSFLEVPCGEDPLWWWSCEYER